MWALHSRVSLRQTPRYDVDETFASVSSLGVYWYSSFFYFSIYEYCFTSLSAQSWQYRNRRKPEDETMPYSYFEWLQGFFIEHSRPTIGSTIHSRPLDSLKHCICTTTMTNIRPDRDSNLVPPGYKPQSIRMNHRGRPRHPQDWAFWCVETHASSICPVL